MFIITFSDAIIVVNLIVFLLGTLIFFDPGLEHAALSDKTQTSSVVDSTSSLMTRHLIESNSSDPDGLAVALGIVKHVLLYEYASHPILSAKIAHLLRPESPATVRRIELELLHLGRVCVSTV